MRTTLSVGTILFCRYSGASTAANELSQQWAVRPSTAHRLEIRRALYLHHSNDKTLREVAAHRSRLTRLLWRCTCSQNAHLRLSKLRFFELRAPKISSCYTTSRLLVMGFAHRFEIRRALYLHYSNDKIYPSYTLFALRTTTLLQYAV